MRLAREVVLSLSLSLHDVRDCLNGDDAGVHNKDV